MNTNEVQEISIHVRPDTSISNEIEEIIPLGIIHINNHHAPPQEEIISSDIIHSDNIVIQPAEQPPPQTQPEQPSRTHPHQHQHQRQHRHHHINYERYLNFFIAIITEIFLVNLHKAIGIIVITLFIVMPGFAIYIAVTNNIHHPKGSPIQVGMSNFTVYRYDIQREKLSYNISFSLNFF